MVAYGLYVVDMACIISDRHRAEHSSHAGMRGSAMGDRKDGISCTQIYWEFYSEILLFC